MVALLSLHVIAAWSAKLSSDLAISVLDGTASAASEALVLVQHAQRLDSEIIYDRDFDYDYFGFKVGCPSFLLLSLL